MMTSIDGRIDCEMTAKLDGVDEYYTSLKGLDTPTTLSGRYTAELEMALPGKYDAKDTTPVGETKFSKKTDAPGYEVIVDTKGTLLWKDDAEYDKRHLIITSEKAPLEYLKYLDSKNISWIACGAEKIDLEKAVQILYREFNVKRMSVVGGPAINTSFLEAHLLDEVSVLIGLGIDARVGFPTLFDGLSKDHSITLLKVKEVKVFDNGAIWARYLFK